MRRILALFAGAVALVVCSMPVQATTVLFDNLGATVATTQNFDNNAATSTLAASFSTGSTPLTLTDVQLNLAVVTYFDPAVTVSLWSDSSTSPGTLMDTLDSNLSVSGNAAVYDLGTQLASLPAILLAANTRYWIQVTQNVQGCLFTCYAVYWSRATTDSGTGVSSEYSSFLGLNSSSGSPFVMEVSGVAVPEPPVLPLFALGFLAMAFLGRRRFVR